jgi:uncharacterized protein involved in outer membrane biogenesis
MKIKKLGKVIGIVAIVVLLLLIIGIVGLNSFLKSERSKGFIVGRMEAMLKAPIEMESFQASLFSGVQLKGLVIENPEDFGEGHFFKADAFVFRYNFFALLRRQIKITKISVVNPDIQLRQKGEGTWNLPIMSTKTPTEKEKHIRKPGLKVIGIPLSAGKITISGGNFIYMPVDKDKILTVRNFGLTGQIHSVTPTPDLKANLSIGRIDVTPALAIENVKCTLKASKGMVYLDEISLRIFDGSLAIKGKSTIPTGEEMPEYKANISIKNVDLDTIVSQFLPKMKDLLKGVLSGDATVQGQGVKLIANLKLNIPSLLVQNQIQIDQIKGNVRYDMPRFTIDALRMNVFGGNVEGKGSGNLRDLTNPSFDLNLTIKKIDSSIALVALGQDSPPAKGIVEGDINVRGTIKNMKADGRLYSHKLNVVKVGTITDIEALFNANLAGEKIKVSLDGFRARVYNGSIGGKASVTVKGKNEPNFSAKLNLSTLDIGKTVKALTGQSLLTGMVEGDAELSGQGKDVETFYGSTNLELKNGRISGHPIQNVLALILQIPALESIDFASGQFSSTISGGVVNVENARVEDPEFLKFASMGTVKLASQEMSLKSHLSLRCSEVNRIKQIRAAFTEEKEPWCGISFKIWGPLSKPKTDLASKLTRQAIGEALRKRIGQDKEEDKAEGGIRDLLKDIIK